jgi:hypothetical protein
MSMPEPAGWIVCGQCVVSGRSLVVLQVANAMHCTVVVTRRQELMRFCAVRGVGLL